MAIHQDHTLQAIGWNDWFEQHNACPPLETVARVVAVDRDQLLLVNESLQFRGRLTGSYRHNQQQAEQLPCVGDWVVVQRHPGHDFGMISALLERKTSLFRKSAGTAIGYQMIAANVDTVFIVQSCHVDFNIRRLERYLVMVIAGGAEACILLTKTDLVTHTLLEARLGQIRAAGINAPVMTMSTVTGIGVDELSQQLQPGRTYCFVGSSGVGKSTLINRLTGNEIRKTNTVSGTGEGRHTTVRRELIRLQGGALLIDNPGMREFGIISAGEGLSDSFADITSLSSACRYRDCTHTGEPGCAVLEAVHAGSIGRGQLEHYLKLGRESEFHERSYADKRKKDREFGKHKQSVNKSLKNR